MNNKAFIVTGYGTARLTADINCKSIRPGGKRISPCPTIDWDDAPQELKDNPKTLWITDNTLMNEKRKRTFRRHTEEEKQEIKLNKIYHIEQMFQYILNNYGWEYAERFVREEKETTGKLGIELELHIPHCEYSNDRQCDIFCPFFKSKCIYKEEA